MITSTVITEPKDWADEGILIPHELIRRGLNTLVELLQLDYPNVYLILKWYNNFLYEFIYHHHCIEETIYFPYINKRATLPEKLSKDHKELTELLNSIGTTIDINLLRERVNKLKTDMFEHLAEEERCIPTALRNNFTKEEDDVVIGETMKSLGMKDLRLLLPWVIDVMNDWMGKEKTRKFYKSLPLIIRIFYRINWKKHYYKHNIGLIKLIKSC